jgi:integrase/recombinase XerD
VDNQKMAEFFLNHLKLRGFRPRTIETYSGKLNQFLDYLAAKEKKISGLVSVDLEDYRAALYYREYHGKPLSLGSQCLQLTVIRVFFKFLAAENLILINPAATLEIPRCPRDLPRTILSAREAAKILDSIDTKTPLGIRDRAIIEVLYSTGIRVTELINLTLTDINFEQGLLRVEDGKGGKTRVVPLGEIAAFYLKEYLKKFRPHTSTPILFLSRWQVLPLTRRAVALICANRAAQAGVKKKVTPHIWRHTCATVMLKSGADIRYIQELLGHTSLKTTQIYTKVTVKDLKKVHARCHPREKDY